MGGGTGGVRRRGVSSTTPSGTSALLPPSVSSPSLAHGVRPRRATSPAMEELMERAVRSPLVEDLVHRLSQPSMISGSDLPRKKVPLSGGESVLTIARPASESMLLRNQKARLDTLMAGGKISKERRYSVVEGKGVARMKVQGFRRVATAVPMLRGSGSGGVEFAVGSGSSVLVEEEGGDGGVGKGVRRGKEEVNYYGYSTQ